MIVEKSNVEEFGNTQSFNLCCLLNARKNNRVTMAYKHGKSTTTSGILWAGAAHGLTDQEDIIIALTAMYKDSANYEELASLFNFIHTRDPKLTKHVRRDDYDIIKACLRKYLKDRFHGNKTAIALIKPVVNPAPRDETCDLTVRGINFHSKTGIVLPNSIFPSAQGMNVLKRDAWGNERQKQWKDSPKANNHTPETVNKIIHSKLGVRKKMAEWLLTLGYSKKTIVEMQELRDQCPIWAGRTSFLACADVDQDLLYAMERVDVLEWEIMTMIKLVPEELIPEKWRGLMRDCHWYSPSGENVAIATNLISKTDGSWVQLAYKMTYAPTAQEILDRWKEVTHIYDIVEHEITINLVTDTSSLLESQIFRKIDVWTALNPGKMLTTTAAYSSQMGRTNVSDEFVRRQQQFQATAKNAVMPDPTIMTGTGVPVLNLAAVTGQHAFTPDSDDTDDDDDDDDNRSKKNIFNPKDLLSRVSRVDLQRSGVKELYQFGKEIQRYAEKRNTPPDMIVDVIITNGKPNERNLAWIKDHFRKPFTMRKNFFLVYREKILPFFSVDKLMEQATKFSFHREVKVPARILGSEYLDSMEAFLMLAKSPQDRTATENYMRARFWGHLGSQLRQSFEMMLVQSKVDPYKMTLEEIVDALKAYANVIGGDVYAQPDVVQDYSVLSTYAVNSSSNSSGSERVNATNTGSNYKGKNFDPNYKRKDSSNAGQGSGSDSNNGRKTSNGKSDSSSGSDDRKGYKNNWKNNSNSKDGQGRDKQWKNQKNSQKDRNRQDNDEDEKVTRGMKNLLSVLASQNMQVPPSYLQVPNQMGMVNPNLWPGANGQYAAQISTTPNTQQPEVRTFPPKAGERDQFVRGVKTEIPYQYPSKKQQSSKNNGKKERGNFKKNEKGKDNSKNDAEKDESKRAPITTGKDGKPIQCHGCGDLGHIRPQCPLVRDQYDSTYDPKRICSSCKETGHWSNDCKKKKGN